MLNPGEIHDGASVDGRARGWRIIYLDPATVAREVREEFLGQVEIVRPVARDPLLAGHFAELWSCCASDPDRTGVNLRCQARRREANDPPL